MLVDRLDLEFFSFLFLQFFDLILSQARFVQFNYVSVNDIFRLAFVLTFCFGDEAFFARMILITKASESLAPIDVKAPFASVSAQCLLERGRKLLFATSPNDSSRMKTRPKKSE